MGAEAEEFEDGLAVTGPQRLRGGVIETAGDHRIAMAFSVAALAAEGVTEIIDADCASVSFPDFYRALDSVTGERR
jgi:3-phosphoshikimate 1-carboxyvinyltransferase